MSWVVETQAELRAFAREREWEQYHGARNLVLALMGELGELAELVQWQSDADLTVEAIPTERRGAMAAEMADVAIYLLRLADVTGVDLEAAVEAKIRLNTERFPQGEWAGRTNK